MPLLFILPLVIQDAPIQYANEAGAHTSFSQNMTCLEDLHSFVKLANKAATPFTELL